MMVTILLVLVFVLLTLGLMLHGVYLESKIDMPCRPSNQHDRMSDFGMARFFGRKRR
jgi:hypothetical protein